MTDDTAFGTTQIKKVWGFVLYFGYVESSRVAPLIIHHTGIGFDTVGEAIASLAHEFLDDYLANLMDGETPGVDGYEQYLYDQVTRVASSGLLGAETFLSSLANAESWWAWDRLDALAPLLDRFYVNEEPAEQALVHFLDHSKITDPAFLAELVELATPPVVETQRWYEQRDVAKTFVPVLPPKPKRARTRKK